MVGFPGVSVRFVGSTGVVGGGGPTYYEKLCLNIKCGGFAKGVALITVIIY